MVQRTRKIIWTSFAIDSRKAIFYYWNNRNKSSAYSKNLNILFQKSLKQVATYPESSIESNIQNIRLRIASHFELIYTVKNDTVYVLDIWDTRQNPQNFPVK